MIMGIKIEHRELSERGNGMSPLALLQEGETAEIVSLAGRFGTAFRGCRRIEHLNGLGFRPGKQVEMVRNRGGGPLVVRIEEACIALGRGIALNIHVRRSKS
jgi:ferrous iron transport protein A